MRTQQAVILAGGMGTRLGEVTRQTPKPVVSVAGRPFMDYLLHHLKRQGVSHVVLSLGYLPDAFKEAFGDGSGIGLALTYVVEPQPMGTGGALRFCKDYLSDSFFVLNGDTLFDVNLQALSALGQKSGVPIAVALREVEEVSRYGSVRLEGGRVISFNEKGHSGPGLINGGVYWLERKVVEEMPEGKSSLETDLLPTWLKREQLAGMCGTGFFIDIGLPETLEAAQSLIPKWERKPIAFLDRDGVLNINHGHVHKSEDFDWMPEAKEAVRLLNDSGYHVVLVTNQAGIAKGYYTDETFLALCDWMQDELAGAGAHLDAIYYCPYHENGTIEEYRKASFDRKPQPGMLLRALDELPSRKRGSFMIGDKESDRQAAVQAEVEFYLYTEGSLCGLVRSVIIK